MFGSKSRSMGSEKLKSLKSGILVLFSARAHAASCSQSGGVCADDSSEAVSEFVF